MFIVYITGSGLPLPKQKPPKWVVFCFDKSIAEGLEAQGGSNRKKTVR